MCISSDAMTELVASKPTGDGQGLPQVNQPQAGLSRREFQTHNGPLGQSRQVDPQSDQRISKLLSRRQVAQRWNCCEHTVARRKDLKPLRFNRRLLRYRLTDIEAIEAAAGV